jgi:hypothetical protein
VSSADPIVHVTAVTSAFCRPHTSWHGSYWCPLQTVYLTLWNTDITSFSCRLCTSFGSHHCPLTGCIFRVTADRSHQRLLQACYHPMAGISVSCRPYISCHGTQQSPVSLAGMTVIRSVLLCFIEFSCHCCAFAYCIQVLTLWHQN